MLSCEGSVDKTAYWQRQKIVCNRLIRAYLQNDKWITEIFTFNWYLDTVFGRVDKGFLLNCVVEQSRKDPKGTITIELTSKYVVYKLMLYVITAVNLVFIFAWFNWSCTGWIFFLFQVLRKPWTKTKTITYYIVSHKLDHL